MKKEPYELSVWEDIPVPATDQVPEYFNEKKIAIIGSHDFDSPLRAHNVSLKENINGEKTLTFNMLRKIKNENGELVDNPLSKLLTNERKLKLRDGEAYPFLDLVTKGESSQTMTVETITNALAPYIIPLRYGAGAVDMSVSGMTNARWLYNGTIYTASRLQLTVQDGDVIYLLVDAFGDTAQIKNNFVTQPYAGDLSDLQGKITYYLDLYGCSLVTGSLADLQGKITYYLNLYGCSLVTGSLADLQGKITYYLDLTNCSLVTGSLADLQGKITYYLNLTNCSLVTGSLADLQGKITYYLFLTNCSLVTGSLADLQGKITNTLSLYNCSLVTGSLADLQGKITNALNLTNCSLVTGSLADLQGKITNTLSLYNCSLVTGSLADLQGKITYYLNLYDCSLVTGSLADLQGKITNALDLTNCSLVTGSLADLQGKITYYLNLYDCSLVTGVYTPDGNGVPTQTYLDYTGLSAADMDATLIAYAATTKSNGTFRANGMTRTSASDAAVSTLQGRGWSVTGITKV